MEYTDYTYCHHFNCLLPSYLPRAMIRDYLNGRAESGDIRRLIHFNTAVRHVEFNNETNEFSVEVEDLPSGSLLSYSFDRIVVAIGHYHVPNMIEIEGVNQFPGRVVHSHEFRGGDEFVGENILIIGGSFSSTDIAMHCSKFGARSVIVSTRNVPVGFKWPNGIRDAPMVIRIEQRKAYFEDNSNVDDIDAIIFCTGYRHSYPFLSKDLRIKCGVTEFVPTQLYKSIFLVDQPFVAYLSVPRQLYTSIMFEMQAAFVRDVFLNRIQLPEKKQQQIEINEWKKREETIARGDFFAMHDLQADYLRDLVALLKTHDDSTLLTQFDFDKSSELFKKYIQSLLDDIVRCRDISYESFVENKHTKGIIQVDKPWFENKDDSMDKLLDKYRNK